ncbi:hypothetical protein NNJEOMEG_02658 [Fundidesulfovibrio magnetotacticus]|uniref:AAA domain-containing protein n=1 Tax=Fundidesulfovibrio magnetotacticus TaxID=2730080 RepID=A0A6V8LV24_9BACT|nr:AAA family ATPase [Fundidesulfovibrio magnetotacticus]GFK94810.1 hypothetical protein NNJEOMEG_02658 [Fundidesulfovibrio magnetotacticus]
MNLVEFELKNYRNITSAAKIKVMQYSVIIGKNNEGKSNLLRALDCAMNLLLATDVRRERERQNGSTQYKFRSDFPVGGHAGKERVTQFVLKFSLDEVDRKDFKKAVRSQINSELSIRITIGIDEVPNIQFIKKGPGAATLAQKSGDIVKFLSNKIQTQYIGAIRTSEQSVSIVKDMVDNVLYPLMRKPEYRAAITTLKELQQPVLNKLSEDVCEVLQTFVPTIVGVDILSPFASRVRNFGCKIEIDDGKKTPLEQKGDGIQSLVSLSLLRHQDKFPGVSLVAIEEPEAHLHQGAIHNIREVLMEISRENQVVISTHNPCFVNREQIDSCVIVEAGRPKNASSIDEIRHLLGITISDSLVASDNIIIVEGEDDVIALQAILSWKSTKIQKLLERGAISFISAHGASKIPTVASFYRNFLCKIICVVDDDDEGRRAIKDVADRNIVPGKDLFKLTCNGMVNSELEDAFRKDVYCEYIKQGYGVDLKVMSKFFNGNMKKWSDRVKEAFERSGKLFDGPTEARIKCDVAKIVKDNPGDIVVLEKCSVIDVLAEHIENEIL